LEESLPKTILVADDFVDYAKLLEGRLKSEGYLTVYAQDGETAIAKAKETKPDLMILDIMMPNISGTEVRVELMKDPSTQDIPIIFLTGLKAPRSKSKAPAANVHVIGKSNDFKELLLAIQELIGKAS
jgi:CheY-like chemotaxis protein